VPGATDGLWTAHRYSQERLGSTVPWGDLLQAAIRHAADGIPVSPCHPRVTAGAADPRQARDPPFAPFRATALDGDAAPAAGRRLAQPALARTLERLAREGGRAFYEGDLAAEIGRACEAVGSPLRAGDLATHRSRFTEPATVPYRGGLAATVPPPCQGLVALAVLGMLDGTDIRACARDPADYVHVAVEATKLAFADRDRWLADPEHVAVPLGRLLDPAYLRDRGRRIAMDRAAPAPLPSGIERGDTIACVTADAAGNCVSLIQSIYHEWGSGVVAGETGVVLQNRGAGFTLDAAHANVLAPGKRPFHTLTPFMYLRDGKPLLVAGTMGGECQPQTLVAVTTRVVDLGLDVQSAVEAPRWVYGRTWGAPTRALSIEGRFGEAVAADLARRGHAVRMLDSWSDTAGHAQALELEPGGLLVGGGDPRADGPALGC
jgi:gamma-glutamyltranspeptidase/glutathione hydrolase